MPSFDKIHPKVTSPEQFSCFYTRSYDFVWDDWWPILFMDLRALSRGKNEVDFRTEYDCFYTISGIFQVTFGFYIPIIWGTIYSQPARATTHFRHPVQIPPRQIHFVLHLYQAATCCLWPVIFTPYSHLNCIKQPAQATVSCTTTEIWGGSDRFCRC